MIRDLLLAARRFRSHDGFALSMQFSVSGLLALFPFFMLIAWLSQATGRPDLAGLTQRIIFMIWPQDIALPLVTEARSILLGIRDRGLILPVIMAPVLASNALEVLRVGLNRAYGPADSRNPVRVRLQTAAMSIAGAFGVFLAAMIIDSFTDLPDAGIRPVDVPTETFGGGIWALLAGVALLGGGLLIIHTYLPKRRPGFRIVWPGVLLALFGMALGSGVMDYYTNQIADFGTTYGGFSAALLSLLVLVIGGASILLGAEFNQVRSENIG